MEDNQGSLLIVDDEPFNREILAELLQDAGYRTAEADCGEDAWQLLQANPTDHDAVLLDRMMPDTDGIEVLRRMKRHPELKALPVIMQTARAGNDDMLEGLKAGAHYYLTKPFKKAALLAIVTTAVTDYRRYRALLAEAADTARTLGLLEHGRFRFRTPTEARDLAGLLANAAPNGQRLVIGLNELFLNAIEHGNLGIDYKEKSLLVERDAWSEEVDRRLDLPEYAAKNVEVVYQRKDGQLEFLITDQGNGFAWAEYVEISPERAFDNHGRGIALSRALSFDSLEYRGKGNQVFAAVTLADASQ